MKDSRRSSSTYAESLFLHVVKHNFFFLFQFFFLSVFFNEYSRFTRQQLKGQTLSLLISFQPLPPASQAFTHQLGYCYRKLTSAHSWQLESNMKSLVQALQNLLFLRLYWQLLFYFVFSFYLSFISRTFRGRRRAFLLTHHYQFHPLHRHLHISRTITAESSPLHIASSRTQTGNLWFPSTRC